MLNENLLLRLHGVLFYSILFFQKFSKPKSKPALYFNEEEI